MGLAAFVVIGLVSPIARGYGVSAEEAGKVMTWYAMAYALGGPLVTALTGATPRRVVLAGGLVLLAAGAGLGAVAPSLALLKASRVIAALGAGLFTPGAAAVVVAMSTPEKRASALSLVFAGLTAAQVLGVPLGSWAGYAFGLPVVFAVVAALALLASVAVFMSIPSELPFQPVSLGVLGGTLASPRLLLPVLFTTTLMGAVYSVYTYLGPRIEEAYGFHRDGVAVYLVVFGVAAVLGNFVGGATSNRFGPSRSLAVICGLQALLSPSVALAPAGPVVMGFLVFAWSLCGWSFMTPQQARLVAIGADRAPVMLALNASAIYLGVALGAAVGGAALGAGRWGGVALVSSSGALAALVHLLGSDWLARRKE